MIFKRFNIFSRVQLAMSGGLLIVFIVVGLFLYFNERENTYTAMQEHLFNEIDELSHVIDIYRVRDRDILNMAANFAEYKINEYSAIEESDSVIVDFNEDLGRYDAIEKLQGEVCKKYKFTAIEHSLGIKGYCRECK